MKMKKYFLTFLLLLFVSSAIFYYYNFTTNNSVKTNALLAIPSRTAAFFYTKDLNALNQKLDSLSYLSVLNQSSIFKDFKQQLILIDSFQNLFKNKEIEINKLVFCVNNVGSSKIGFLNIIDFKTVKLASFFQNKIDKNIYKIETYNYKEFKIITIKHKKNKHKISFSVYNNLLLLSQNSPLVEEALNSLKNEKHKTLSKEFKDLNIKNINKASIHLFIDYNAISDINTLLFSKDFLNKKSKDLKNVNWSYYAIYFNKNNISYKSSYSFEYNDNSTISYIANSKPKAFSLDLFLPNNTAYAEIIKSKNNNSFQSNNDSYKYFSTWLDEEIAFFSLETFGNDFNKKSALVLKTKNIDTAKINLYLLNKEMAPVADYDGLAIYEMNVDVLSNFFKNNLFSFEKPYFAFIGKYVVFVNDINVIRVCYQKYKSNQFLRSDLKFQTFIKEKNGLTNSTIYIQAQRWRTALNNIFNKQIIPSDIGKIKQETFVTDSIIYSIGEVNFQKDKIKKTTNIWNAILDTVSYFKPQIVIIADNKRKEILTQDEKNQVYLISQSGDIIFKKQIKEKIFGEVFQIDFYKTNKLQYVFNTKNYIYLLDRKGRVVDGFPLKLPAEATNSIFVVNYDKAKVYRYFIACNNQKIYGYEANGKPLKAWSPLGNFGTVKSSIKHATFNGKDYLFFNNKEGTFYAFNRKGEKRFTEVVLNTEFIQAFEKDKNGFINLGEGSIYKIDLNGKTTVKIIGDNTYKSFTNYLEKNAFAIANKNEFRVAKSKWTILGKKKLNDEIIAVEKVKIQTKTWFLVSCKKSIYLINDLGEIHPDFPMLANSVARVSAFYNNKNEIMIFHEDNKLKAFELLVTK